MSLVAGNVRYTNGYDIALIVPKSLFLWGIGVFRYQEKVFVIPLHEVFFPCVFFHNCRVGFQAFEVLPFGFDLFGVEIPAFLKVSEFLSPFKLGKNIVFVQEQDHHAKNRKCDKVFVFDPGRDMGENSVHWFGLSTKFNLSFWINCSRTQ